MADRRGGFQSDISQLEDLNENTILDVIHGRYSADQIYTSCGDILIAVNPCKELQIYDTKHHERYSWKNYGTKEEPHVFQVAARAYRRMHETETNQVIMVCGESGSGKTESTKYMVKHFVDMCPDETGDLHDRIVKINPLIEAFGNAKTVRNENSSRFAKYLGLSFAHDGQVLGATIRDYMLEKSRVVSQGRDEGNFHIFYSLFAGMPPKQRSDLGLQKPETYRIMQSSIKLLRETGHYAKQYTEHMEVLRKIGLSEQDIGILHCMLASILHLTQLEFQEKDSVSGELDIKDKEPLLLAADQLSIKVESLGHALIATTTNVAREEIKCFKSLLQAEDGRDALAKTLYERLFGWIILKINDNLHPNQQGSQTKAEIGLLDIAGFERLEKNSFEQMCINLTNERLQKFMNRTIIMDEKDIYMEEGISIDDIQFEDNQDIIQIFEKSGVGILPSLDEESRLQQGTDLNFVHKVKDSFRGQPEMKYLTFPKGDYAQFTVKHFAGEVSYDCTSFLEKNRDTLNKDLHDCLKSSSDPFIADLFKIQKGITGTISTTRADIRQSRRGPGKGPSKPLSDRGRILIDDLSSTLKNRFGKIGKATEVLYQPRKDSKTVTSFFQKSISELLSKMQRAEPHFVRCIKPNAQLSADLFDREVVKEQLRYNGVSEIARIRRLGFSVRKTFNSFIKRYSPLYPEVNRNNVKDGVTEILQKFLPRWCSNDYRMGKRQVFMKEHVSIWLEKCIYLREKTAVAVLVKRVRTFLEYRREQRELQKQKKYADADKLKDELKNLSVRSSMSDTMTSETSSSTSSRDSIQMTSLGSSIGSSNSKLASKYRATRKDHSMKFEERPPTPPPPRKSSVKTPEVEEKPQKPFWDIFQIIARESRGGDVHTHRLMRIIKLITYFILFVILLFCLVAQKVSLMTLISGLQLNTSEHAKPKKEEVALVSARYILVMVAICIPYILIFITSLWKSLFGNLPFPHFGSIIVVFFIEVSHSIGLCLLVFRLLRELNMASGIMILSGTCIIPSILKPLCTTIVKKRGPCNNMCCRIIAFMFDMMALVVQLSVIPVTVLPIIGYTTDGTGKEFEVVDVILTALALLLCSLSWWENFIDDRFCGKLSKNNFMYRILMTLKFDLQESRPFIYIPASLGKLVTSVVGAYLLMDEDLKFDLPGVISTLEVQAANLKLNAPIITLVLSAFVAYYVSYTACKLKMQTVSFCFPMFLATPISVVVVVLDCKYSYLSLVTEDSRQCDGINGLDIFSPWYHVLCGAAWLISMYWVGRYIFFSDQERLAKVERLFMNPLYCGILLEQHLLMNRRRHNRRITRSFKENKTNFNMTKEDAKVGGTDENSEMEKDIPPMIYACATMWHETRQEMVQILKSLFRMDKDQFIRRQAYKMSRDLKETEYYEFESHIMFDDAFTLNDEEEMVPNQWVRMLAQLLDEACSSVHSRPMVVDPPFMIPSPYGGQLVYTMPYGNLMFVHMKDKSKIRHRKRWSQVMYMYYLLGYRIIRECQENILTALQTDSEKNLASWDETIRTASGVIGKSKIFQMMEDEVLFKAENTFLLALDGDVDFTPGAVRLLMDRMSKNSRVGAACGRIHPIGQGPMVWYQKFEYAVAHWLQKSTEHVLGCVLCSPGCFSLFRGSALMDDNVMRKYTIMPTEASHHLMYDQGEDRWLCTLLLQQGYRVDYAAASDAYTYAPEAFGEFFNQRRRWMPSTIANIMDLLQDGKNTVAANNNISWLYIFYQAALMLSTIIGPSTVLMMIAGAILVVFDLNLIQAYIISMVPATFFFFLCFVVKAKYQILVAQILSAIYTFIMMVVLVGAIIMAVQESPFHPSVLFLMGLVFIFLIAGLFHPQEFTNLIYGTLYFLWVPTGFLLLVLYSLCNMHVVSWGTREVPKTKTKAEIAEEEKKKKEEAKKKKESWFSRFFPKISMQDIKEMFSETAKKEDKTTQLLEQMNKNFEILIKQQGGTPADDTTLKEVVVGKGKQKKSVTFSPSVDKVDEKTKEEKEEEEEYLYQKQKKKRDDLKNPAWVEIEEFKGGDVIQMTEEEVGFWSGFVGRYLYPLDSDKKKQEETQKKLIELRNNICAGMALINLLWIAINFMFQLKKPTVVTFPSPVGKDDDEVKEELIKVDILGLLFVIYFLLILVIQFIGMIVHRWGTFMHLIAITELPKPSCSKDNDLQSVDFEKKGRGKIAVEFCERMTTEPMPDYSDDEDENVMETDIRQLQRENAKQQIENLGRTGIRDRFDMSQSQRGIGISMRNTSFGMSFSQSISDAKQLQMTFQNERFKQDIGNYLRASRNVEEVPHSAEFQSESRQPKQMKFDIGHTLPREVRQGQRKFGSTAPYQDRMCELIKSRGLQNKVDIGQSRRPHGAEGSDLGRSYNRDRDYNDDDENIYDEVNFGELGKLYTKKMNKFSKGKLAGNGTVSRRNKRNSYENQWYN